MIMEAKFKNGSRVKVKYGHLIWQNNKAGGVGLKDSPTCKLISTEDHIQWFDIRPELTKDIATVAYTYGEKSETDFKYSKTEDGYKKYSLIFDNYGSISWFHEDQLEVI